MKNKWHLLIGGCAVLLVGLHSPVSANSSEQLIHSLLNLNRTFTRDKEQMRQEIVRLEREKADLKAKLREVRQQAWQKVKTEFKKPPSGYSSWQQYHNEQRKKDMDRR